MWLVDFLSAGYGIGSWIAMTGLWVELPLLVQRLPEGWALASQLSLFLQVGNIGPILYGLFHLCSPRCATERLATHIQLAIGTLSTFLLIFMWDWTTFGRSIPLFILSFGLSLVDCTSSVVFLPFMANFKSRYLTPYLVGEGLSGLLPSLVAMVQGITNPECVNETRTFQISGINMTEVVFVPIIKEPRFEPEWFFAILLAMVLFSWISFILLDMLPSCKKEKVKYIKKNQNRYELQHLNEEKKSEDRFVQKNKPLNVYMYLLFLQFWASLITFGIFPPIQPYSCLPYGEVPFHLTVTLCGVAYPAACFLAFFLQVRSIAAISWMSVVFTILSVYAMVTALLSPHPPFVNSTLGSYLIVTCWVTFMFAFSYIKTMVTIILGDDYGHTALFWCGAVTQGGAVLGAIVMFFLVNFFDVFQDEGMCFV